MSKASSAVLEQIFKHMDSFIKDASKYKDKGIKAAAKRARKTTTELTKLFKEYRRLTINETKK